MQLASAGLISTGGGKQGDREVEWGGGTVITGTVGREGLHQPASKPARQRVCVCVFIFIKGGRKATRH